MSVVALSSPESHSTLPYLKPGEAVKTGVGLIHLKTREHKIVTLRLLDDGSYRAESSKIYDRLNLYERVPKGTRITIYCE